MLNSLKQLIRTPVKLILFLLLMAASTALLVLGANLWQDTQQKIDRVEESFTTIGTVSQKENTIDVFGLWNAASKTYINYSNPVYDSIISDDILDFEGANYTHGPERRPFYTTILPEYKHSVELTPFADTWIIAEFEPLEDCVPSEPVQVKVKRVLFGDMHGSETFWLCDHYTENPAALEAGKTYISIFNPMVSMHPNLAEGQSEMELIVVGIVYSSQYDENGNRLMNGVNSYGNSKPNWEEITDNFYEEGGRGKYWEAFAEGLRLKDSHFPVLPTDSLNLLPTFHTKNSYIMEGRGITEEEFEAGAPVCVVPLGFASANGLKVGDSIPLAMLYSSYSRSPAFNFSLSDETSSVPGTIDADGELYEPFWEDTYEIVGLYFTSNTKALSSKKDEMGYDLIIIPSKSVKASDENNIVDYGVMLASNTSFQIQNGTIDKYMEAFNQNVPAEVRDYLEITFDDGGYSQVIKGLNNMRYVAILLFAAGLFAALVIIILLLYFFIVKQKKRTAIERSLGMSRRQCRMSLVSGVVILSAVAIILGTIGSTFLIDKVEALDLTGQAEQVFSTEYSLWAREEAELPEEDEEDSPSSFHRNSYM